jgi:hypothetical protein
MRTVEAHPAEGEGVVATRTAVVDAEVVHADRSRWGRVRAHLPAVACFLALVPFVAQKTFSAGLVVFLVGLGAVSLLPRRRGLWRPRVGHAAPAEVELGSNGLTIHRAAGAREEVSLASVTAAFATRSATGSLAALWLDGAALFVRMRDPGAARELCERTGASPARRASWGSARSLLVTLAACAAAAALVPWAALLVSGGGFEPARVAADGTFAAMTAFLLCQRGWSARPRTLCVGADGVGLRTANGQRFVPYRRVFAVYAAAGRVELLLHGQRRWSLRPLLEGRGPRDFEVRLAQAIAREIEAGRARARATPAPSETLRVLDRGGRPIEPWLAPLRAPASSREAYRRPSFEVAELTRVALAPDASPDRRIAAATLLGRDGGLEPRRVRRELAATVDDVLREALTHALDGDIHHPSIDVASRPS